MKEENFNEREYASLERRLRNADLSADSRVKDVLKARLLSKARRPALRVPVFAWLAPVFAVAALFFLLGPRRAAAPAGSAANSGYSYSMPDDAYGECGRRGLAGGAEPARF